MRTTMSLWMGLLAVAVALGWPDTARATGAGVQDTAGLFSHDAVAKAEQQIASIATRFGKDLRIETYARIPPALADQYTPDKQQAFFATWAYQRGKAAGVDGVLLLICQNPAFLQVAVGERTQQQAFPLANRDHLRDLLVAAFRQKHYDEGLLQAVAYYGQILQTQLGTPGTPSSPATHASPGPHPSPSAPAVSPRQTPSGASPLLWAVVILVALGLCLWWVRSRRGGRGDDGRTLSSPGYPPPDSRYGGGYGGGYSGGYGGGAGGGFGRGFGAGLLGGLLGGWLGNRLGRHDASPPTDASSWPSPGASEGGGSFGPAVEPDFSGQGPRDVGGGGDFGGGSDSGGGGDFGGGSDAGGGSNFGSYSDSGGGGEIREEN